tara:strand:+ start:167 stop:328 length:162 start_codon:yes stop_codon:yes gene_type:complete
MEVFLIALIIGVFIFGGLDGLIGMITGLFSFLAGAFEVLLFVIGALAVYWIFF